MGSMARRFLMSKIQALYVLVSHVQHNAAKREFEV